MVFFHKKIIFFLVFLFGTLTALHIDSKLYEDTYKEKKAASKKNNEASSKFRSLTMFNRNDRENIDKWNEFITEATSYLDKDDYSTLISSNIISNILSNYKRE